MAEYTVREYRAADIPALSFLWRDVFGDPLAFTAEFYALLPGMGSAMVAEKDGRLVGAAHVLDGFSLAGRRKKSLRVGYLYAVMVAEEYRGLGIGKALTLEAAALAKRRDAAIVCTLPADAPLYGWYHGLLSFECVLHRKKYEVGCQALLQVTELSAAEYMQRREQLLTGKTWLRPTLTTMEFQRRFCAFFGGGLYACGSGICAAVMDGDVCLIKELITPVPEECVPIAASVGKLLNAKKTVYYLPAREGASYIAAQPGSIPADCVWNLSFD